MSKEEYWLNYWILVGIAYFWLFMFWAVLLRFEVICKKLCLFKWIGTISYYLTPILEEILYIPTIFVMTDIFSCIKARDLDKNFKLELHESFLTSDCSLTCFKNEHFTKLIITSTALILYLPLSILCKPHWQDL